MKKIIIIFILIFFLQSCAYNNKQLYYQNKANEKSDYIIEDCSLNNIGINSDAEYNDEGKRIETVISKGYNLDEKELESIITAVLSNEYPYFKDAVSCEIKEDGYIKRQYWSTKYGSLGPDPTTLEEYDSNIQFKTQLDRDGNIPVIAAYVYVNGRPYVVIAEYSEYYEKLLENMEYNEFVSKIRKEDRSALSAEIIESAKIIGIEDFSADSSNRWIKSDIATKIICKSKNDMSACDIVNKQLGTMYGLYIGVTDNINFNELFNAYYPIFPLTSDRVEKMLEDIEKIDQTILTESERDCLFDFTHIHLKTINAEKSDESPS